MTASSARQYPNRSQGGLGFAVAVDGGSRNQENMAVPLTNAQKQDRYRERHQVLLTARAEEIAEKLIEMADQAKLRKIARLVNDHLTHPDRTPTEGPSPWARRRWAG
jgi:hypothetical protein